MDIHTKRKRALLTIFVAYFLLGLAWNESKPPIEIQIIWQTFWLSLTMSVEMFAVKEAVKSSGKTKVHMGFIGVQSIKMFYLTSMLVFAMFFSSLIYFLGIKEFQLELVQYVLTYSWGVDIFFIRCVFFFVIMYLFYKWRVHSVSESNLS